MEQGSTAALATVLHANASTHATLGSTHEKAKISLFSSLCPPPPPSRPPSSCTNNLTAGHHAPSSLLALLRLQFFVRRSPENIAFVYYVLINLPLSHLSCARPLPASRAGQVEIDSARRNESHTWRNDSYGGNDAGATRAWDHHWQGHLEGQSLVGRLCCALSNNPQPRYVVLGTGAALKAQEAAANNNDNSVKSSSRKGLKATASKPSLVDVAQLGAEDRRLYISIYKAKVRIFFSLAHCMSDLLGRLRKLIAVSSFCIQIMRNSSCTASKTESFSSNAHA